MTYQFKINNYQRFFIIFSLSCLLLLNPKLTFAKNNQQYTVNNIIASAQGKSPNQARSNAIASGQRNAFLILLERLKINKTIADDITNETIADMVFSQQILDEKISNNQYSATLNLKFSKNFVAHHLGKNFISLNNQPILQQPDYYLIIPIKLIKNQKLLWERNNDWKQAIKNALKNNPTPLLKIPTGDIDDIITISTEDIKNFNFSYFKPILNKYQANIIILAYFDFDSLENKVDITLKNIQQHRTTHTELNFINVKHLSPQSLVDEVANKTIGYITQSNHQLLTRSTISGAYSSHQIDVLISDLDDWLKVKNKLQDSNIISQLTINSISQDVVDINISYNNSAGNIIDFFAQDNFFLQQKNEGGYFLSLTKLQ